MIQFHSDFVVLRFLTIINKGCDSNFYQIVIIIHRSQVAFDLDGLQTANDNQVFIILMNTNQKLHLEKHACLKQMTTQQLKSLLAKLEDNHDTLEAKNEEISIQISDLRNAVKCVENQRKDNAAYEIQKKKELQNKIDSLEKGLKYANKNDSYETMEQYKAVME